MWVKLFRIYVKKWNCVGVRPRKSWRGKFSESGEKMVKINREEAMYIRGCMGKDFTITRTMVQKSDRHAYYMPETVYAMSLLRQYREGKVVAHYE